MHTAVLLQQIIKSLEVKKNGLYIDATAGEGGYLKEIINLGGKVLGIDWDEDQVNILKKEFENKAKIVWGNFSQIKKIAEKNHFLPVDGIIFDLGLSMRQISGSRRGFSYKNLNEVLDMRINKKLKIRASDLVNSLSFKELYEIFARNSEEIYSRAICRAIIKRRSLKKIVYVRDLIELINRVLTNKNYQKKIKVYQRVFQALRIAVNNEFENLRKGLEGGLKILKKQGRILVLTFHSLEDRIVKKFVKEKKIRFLTKKPIFGQKSFERSAKLRVISF